MHDGMAAPNTQQLLLIVIVCFFIAIQLVLLAYRSAVSAEPNDRRRTQFIRRTQSIRFASPACGSPITNLPS